MRISDWSSDVCSSDLSPSSPTSPSTPIPRRVPAPGSRRRLKRERSMRKIKVLSAAVAILLQVSPAAAADKLTLILDWFVNPDHGPIIVAQEQGYFAEQGLAVEVIAPADPSAPPTMVAAGKADLAVDRTSTR